MIVKTVKIDTKTGEVIRESAYECSDNENNKGALYKFSQYGTRIFPEYISENIDLNTLGRFMILLKSMNRENVLVKRTAYDRNVPLKSKDLEAMFELGNRQTRKIMRTLEEHSLVRKTPNGYIVNPMIVTKGKRISHIAYDAYKDILQDVLPGYIIADMERYRQENDNI